MKVAVIGSGSWGTALALKSCRAGQDTYLYCRREAMADALRTKRENTDYLPGVTLPETLYITASPEEALRDADVCLLVTPSVYVRKAITDLKQYMKPNVILALCSKGMERETGKTLTEAIREALGDTEARLVVLSGPNHAEEVARDLPAATVAASNDTEAAMTVQQALSFCDFRVYVNDDMIGVELAATTKNIIALAAGIADGMKLGDNCKAALLTRGLYEMTLFGTALGASPETYAGLAGMGDLVATCMSRHSRNRAAGQKLANGETMDYIMNHTNMVVEGFFAVRTVYETAKSKHVEMPITAALYDVLYHQKSPADALMELMSRDLKAEMHVVRV